MAPPIKFSSQAKKKRRIAFAKKSAVFFVLVLLLGGGVLFLFKNEKFLVSAIEVSGNSSLSNREVQTLVEDNLLGYYFEIIPKRSIFFYPRRGIEQSIRDKFPRVSQASVVWKRVYSPGIIEVLISERSPAYIWCGNALPDEEDENLECYFTDSTGAVYDPAPKNERRRFIALYGNLSGDIAKGSFLGARDFSQLSNFIISVSEEGLLPVALVKKEDGDAEILLARGGKIIFPVLEAAKNLAGVISSFESALEARTLKEGIEKNPEKLLYIDLRFGNKVFYKFK